MKKIKWFMTRMMCMVLLTGVFSGCGAEEPDTAGPDTVEDSPQSAAEPSSETEGEASGDNESSAEDKNTGPKEENVSTEEENTGSEGGTDSADAGQGYEIPDVNIDPYEVPDNEALQFVKNMKIGWNLGNTFDAIDGNMSNELDYESYWCGVITTKDMIDDIKEAGFNSVRIPVSWHNHVDENYRISEAWLDRVQEVVDYVYDNGMYVILNIHHDNSENFMYPDSAHLEQSVRYVTAIWEQLCRRFGEYDEHLIFECMNEPRMVGSQYEWWINADAEECKDAIACINEINQAFVNTVRAGGDKNVNRYLMIPGYDASPDGALNSGFTLPTDAEGVENRLIVSIHAYTPYNFALQAPGESSSTASFDSDAARSTADISSFMDKLYNKFVKNGIPVVIGEFGSRDKNQNIQDRIDHATYYIAAARARGISCLWWDNNAFTGDGEKFGIYQRENGSFPYPDIVTALMKYAE